jgi:transcription initiation factor TFIIIB Brf1 subunit/transcription initiation factor TFIIB
MSFCKEETRFFDDATAPLSTDHKAAKSIRKELDLLVLSEAVKDLADRIYAEKVGTNTYRSNVRQEVKFNCLFEAFKQLGIYKDPCEIAKMLKIKRKGMSRGILRCSFLCTGKETTQTMAITAVHLVPEMLTRNGVEFDSSHIEDIARIHDYAKERSELLNRSKPQSIASSLVYFYLRKKDKDRKINKADLAKNCGVSAMTISKLDAELEEILGDKLDD